MFETYLDLPIHLIEPSPFNPRKTFDPVALEELAQTIREHGVLEPAVVRENAHDLGYELVMGERRLRASKLAGLDALPCIVRTYTDAQVLEVIVIENNQRADVNAAEESEGFAAILNLPDYQALGKKPAVEQLAKKLGRSTSYVWQRLKLADLTDEAREELHAGAITPGHAILLARQTPEFQTDLLTELLYDKDYSRGQSIRGARRPGGVRWSVRDLGFTIAQKGGVSLGYAPFDLDSFVPPVGERRACLGCPFRSLSDPGADADTVDMCRNPKCFDAKCAAHVEARMVEVEQDWGRKPLRVSLQWYSDDRSALSTEKYSVSKEDAKDSVAAVVVETSGRHNESTKRFGELVWIKLKKQENDSARASEEARQRKEVQRQTAVEIEIRKKILQAVIEAVPTQPDILLMRLLAWETLTNAYHADGYRFVEEVVGVDGIPERNKVKVEDFARCSMADLVRLVVGFCAGNDLDLSWWQMERGNVKTPRLDRVAELFGVDHERIRKESMGQGKLFDVEEVAA